MTRLDQLRRLLALCDQYMADSFCCTAALLDESGREVYLDEEAEAAGFFGTAGMEPNELRNEVHKKLCEMERALDAQGWRAP